MLSMRFPVVPTHKNTTTLSHHLQNKSFSSVTSDRDLAKRNRRIRWNFGPSISSPRFRKLLVNGALIVPPPQEEEEEEEEEEGEVGKKRPAEVELPAGLRLELMPKHVSVTPDGHRRWARKRGLPIDEGYKALGRRMAKFIRLCCKWGVPVLTFYAFSTENWSRSKEDVDSFMNWSEMWIKSVTMEKWMRNNVRLSVIGDKSMLPNSLQQVISEAEEALKANTRLHFIIGLSYGGRYDILQACKSVASKVKDGLIQLEDIDQSIFEQELETKCTKFPNPDLHIRTSGELRLSNFMLWQVHFTEFYFANKCFPDFEEADFIEALNSYQKRDRRFGGR
ncbi:unnamed protein product [Ilex paraguariensis]|uniref:Alkyl transferase n=1 Tax=Ilex paraguariensis TaxID=185542 RepID=A0ABC8RU59_9AQUA